MKWILAAIMAVVLCGGCDDGKKDGANKTKEPTIAPASKRELDGLMSEAVDIYGSFSYQVSHRGLDLTIARPRYTPDCPRMASLLKETGEGSKPAEIRADYIDAMHEAMRRLDGEHYCSRFTEGDALTPNADRRWAIEKGRKEGLSNLVFYREMDHSALKECIDNSYVITPEDKTIMALHMAEQAEILTLLKGRPTCGDDN